jgi:energy-coupling factor transport system ATP-binding protein
LNSRPAREASMIELERVSLNYGGADRPALDGLDLSIAAGESVAVVGPSGSGKTTFLRLLNALLIPTGGRVLVDGIDTRDEARLWDVRRRVGLIFQNPDNQLVSTTVERELAFGMENIGLPRAEIAARIEEVVSDFDLEDLRGRPPHRLSGGEKQRVAVAAVLAMRPVCLALDEPTSLLDGQGRRDVWRVVERLSREGSRTVIHVTQFPDEVTLSSRVLVLVEGRIVFDGSPEELFSRRSDVECWGLRPPAAVAMRDALGRAGYAVPGGIPSLDALAESVSSGRGRGTG